MSDKTANKKQNAVLVRSLTGAVYISTIILAVTVGGPTAHIIFGLLGTFTLIEFYKMFDQSVDLHPNIILGTVLGTIIYSAFCLGTLYGINKGAEILLAVLVSSSFIIIATAELFRKKDHVAANIGVTIGGLLYIIFPFCLMQWIPWMSSGFKEYYSFPLMGVFILIWVNDTFAYLVGRKFGKHKMLERISPNKTWEGFAGGFIFALGGAAVIACFLPNGQYGFYLILAALTAIFGTIGDFVESLIKRSLNLKDSGSILPGHGGLLDRLDSLLFAIPVLFCAYLLAILLS